MRVGFIGLGHMGAGMAASLMRAGHDVTVWNRTREKAEPLTGEGATVADSIAEASGGDAVVTMLADDRAAEAVVLGENGILAHLKPGALHVSASTISVALSGRLEAAHRQAGQRYVSAPVLGRPDVAAKGELFIVAAGDPQAIDDAAPLLDAMGKQTIRFGDRAADANLVKLSVNFMIATVFESLGEAIGLVERRGIDTSHYVDFLTSTLFGAPVYKVYGALVAADEPPPVGFAARLGLKDIRFALAAAKDLAAPMPFASLLEQRFEKLLAEGGENQDWAAVGRMTRARPDQAPPAEREPAQAE